MEVDIVVVGVDSRVVTVRLGGKVPEGNLFGVGEGEFAIVDLCTETFGSL